MQVKLGVILDSVPCSRLYETNNSNAFQISLFTSPDHVCNPCLLAFDYESLSLLTEWGLFLAFLCALIRLLYVLIRFLVCADLPSVCADPPIVCADSLSCVCRFTLCMR